jgi:hypothetical protein
LVKREGKEKPRRERHAPAPQGGPIVRAGLAKTSSRLCIWERCAGSKFRMPPLVAPPLPSRRRRTMGEREAVLRVEQEDKGRHCQRSRSMAQRSSVHLSAGFAAYASARSARRRKGGRGEIGGTMFGHAAGGRACQHATLQPDMRSQRAGGRRNRRRSRCTR